MVVNAAVWVRRTCDRGSISHHHNWRFLFSNQILQGILWKPHVKWQKLRNAFMSTDDERSYLKGWDKKKKKERKADPFWMGYSRHLLWVKTNGKLLCADQIVTVPLISPLTECRDNRIMTHRGPVPGMVTGTEKTFRCYLLNIRTMERLKWRGHFSSSSSHWEVPQRSFLIHSLPLFLWSIKIRKRGRKNYMLVNTDYMLGVIPIQRSIKWGCYS